MLGCVSHAFDMLVCVGASTTRRQAPCQAGPSTVHQLPPTLSTISPFSVRTLRCCSLLSVLQNSLNLAVSSLTHTRRARLSSQKRRHTPSTLLRYTRTSSRRYWGSRHRKGLLGLSLCGEQRYGMHASPQGPCNGKSNGAMMPTQSQLTKPCFTYRIT